MKYGRKITIDVFGLECDFEDNRFSNRSKIRIGIYQILESRVTDAADSNEFNSDSFCLAPIETQAPPRPARCLPGPV